mgnify:CR=1 FL=1
MTDFDNVRSDTLRGDAESLAQLADGDGGIAAHKVKIDTDEGTLRVRAADGALRLETTDE